MTALGHRDPITIFVKNNIPYGKKSKSLRDSPQRIELKVYTSTLIWEIKEILGRIFEEDPRKIKLEKVMTTYQTYTIKDTENGMTLENLYIGMN